AFRKLAKEHHPDVSKSPDAKEKFAEINQAHQEALDILNRKSGGGPEWFSGNFEDMFSFFRPQNMRVIRNIQVSLRDAYIGKTININVSSFDGSNEVATIEIPKRCRNGRVIRWTSQESGNTIDFVIAVFN